MINGRSSSSIAQNFDKHTSEFYNSKLFKQKADQAAEFLHALKPYVGNRDVTLENMVCFAAVIFDAVSDCSTILLVERKRWLVLTTVESQIPWVALQIFDFMNVQYIHNATFMQELPPTFLPQARDLANFHEYGVFSDWNPNGIGNSTSVPHQGSQHADDPQSPSAP